MHDNVGFWLQTKRMVMDAKYEFQSYHPSVSSANKGCYAQVGLVVFETWRNRQRCRKSDGIAQRTEDC